MITCMHTLYQDFVGGCEGSAKRRTVPLCCTVTSTVKKNTVSVISQQANSQQSPLTYAAKDTNDACFKGAAQKISQYTHTSGTTKMSVYTHIKTSTFQKTTTLIWMSKLTIQLTNIQISGKQKSYNLFVNLIHLHS